MEETLLKYSQISCAVAFLLYGLSLLVIGRPSHQYIKRAKWLVALAMILFGGVSIVLYDRETTPYIIVDTAIEIIVIYVVTLLLALAFMPFFTPDYVHSRRWRVACGGLLLSSALGVAACMMVDSEAGYVLLGLSLVVYILELVGMVNRLVFSPYELQEQPDHLLNAAAQDMQRWFARYALFFSLFTILCPFFSFMPIKFVAMYNFLAIAVWGFMFISFVNFMMRMSSLDSLQQGVELQSVERIALHPQLQATIDRWVDAKGYCERGITMAQLAVAMNTNRSYLSQHINTRYGCNFNTWLMQLRVEEAKRLMLASPTLPLDEVASRVGFSSKSHFMSCFKSLEDTTPGQWRQSQTNQSPEVEETSED